MPARSLPSCVLLASSLFGSFACVAPADELDPGADPTPADPAATAPAPAPAEADPVPLAATPLPRDLPADRIVRVADAQSRLPGRYIVVLASTTSLVAPDLAARTAAVEAAASRLATTYRATVEHHYTTAVRGFSAQMSEADARALAADPAVAYLEEDALAHADYFTQSQATWGLDRSDQASLPLDTKYVFMGDAAGTTVYVLDSGIRATHTEFTGRILPGVTMINDGQGTNDCNGHGTHVAGTAVGSVLGVAKKANVVAVRVLGCDGSGPVTGIIAGVDWVTANKRPRSVVNMSLGNPPSPTQDASVNALIAAGAQVVASAGNNNTNACNQSPGRNPNAITVAATDQNDVRATFSNYGTCVDIHAPGVAIVAASFNGDTLARTLNGTSMSTPHVAGSIAVYLGINQTATPQQVTQALLAGGTPNKVSDLQGSPNLLLNTSFTDAAPPTASITSPADGAQVEPSFTVTAQAADPNLARVELAVDGTKVDTRTEGPLAFPLTLPVGAHTITLTAIDAASKTTTRSIQITVMAKPGPGGGNPDPTDPTEPGGGNEPTGGCSAGGAGGAGGLAVALLALIPRRRRRA